VVRFFNGALLKEDFAAVMSVKKTADAGWDVTL
jgi:hypothetical protein